MAWISFDDIKKTVSLEMVINRYKFQLRGIGTATLRGKCPLPMHGSDKSRDSFTATLTKGTGGVWACQSSSCVAARNGKKGGNALDLVATMEGCSIRDAAEKLASWFSATPIDGQRVVTPQPASEINKPDDVLVNKPLGFTLSGINPCHPYLESRGVTEDVARAFGVGYFSGRGTMHGRVVFPIHNEAGELVSYAGRSIDETEPRYKFPAGFHKTLELFNLHRVIAEKPRRVVIVEGFFGCITVAAAGSPCIALMGSSLSEVQATVISSHFKEACLLFDGDEAGRKVVEESLLRLGCHLFVRAYQLSEGEQPDALTMEELQSLIAS